VGTPRGRIRPGVVLFLLVVASGGYLCTKFVPPYWTYFSLHDPVKEAAMMAATRPQDEVKLRTSLIERAREEGLALTDEDIEFTRDGPTLAVRVKWIVPVDLPRFRYTLRFQIEQTALLP